MLLDRHREVGAALDRGVVGDDHALLAVHHANPGDYARPGRLVVVHPVRREGVQFKKGGFRVEQGVDPFTGGHFATFLVPLDILGRSARPDLFVKLEILRFEAFMMFDVCLKIRIGCANLGRDTEHGQLPVMLEIKVLA